MRVASDLHTCGEHQFTSALTQHTCSSEYDSWVQAHDSRGGGGGGGTALAYSVSSYGLVSQEARLSARGRRHDAQQLGDVVARLTW